MRESALAITEGILAKKWFFLQKCGLDLSALHDGAMGNG
jgi:hypothetical protein